jgi:HlyD family secretion protein
MEWAGVVDMRLALVAVLLCALIVGLGYKYKQEDQAATFITAPVERGKISTLVKATGAVEAVLTVDVSSQLSGRIADVFVNFNDPVRAGQPIAQLDQEIFAARVNEARAILKVAAATALVQKAALERAAVAVANAQTAKKLAEAQSGATKARQDEVERDLQRKLELARTGSVTDRELTQARAQRDSGAADLRASVEQINMKEEAIAIAEAEKRMAEANIENAQAIVEQRQAALDQAQLDLDRTVLRAPIDGMIIKRDVNPGQTVAVSLEAKTLFRIANDLREMEVHGRIDEADVGELRIGQTALFTVDAFPERTFTGRVLQIRKSPEVVQNVVTYTTIISAPNPELLLLPGMTAALRIVVSDTEEILKIPNQALRFRPNGTSSKSDQQDRDQTALSPEVSATVWAVGIDGRPVPVAVKLGVSDDQSTQLTGGSLKQDQQLIVGIAHSQSRTGFFGIRLGF